MKVFVLLAFIPSLIGADILCPNSKTTCPNDQQCCEIDGEYSCCDPDSFEDVSTSRMKVYPGVEVMSAAVFENTSISTNDSKLHYSGCTVYNCQGKCCEYGCCSFSIASCCKGGYRCCPNFSQCCTVGCCESWQSCCGIGCCDFGYKCCGSWCCKNGYKCGKLYKTCLSKGATLSPEIVAFFLIALSVFSLRL